MILRRFFQFVVASTLSKAWKTKSPKWLSIAGILVLWRFFDKRAGRPAPAPKKSGRS